MVATGRDVADPLVRRGRSPRREHLHASRATPRACRSPSRSTSRRAGRAPHGAAPGARHLHPDLGRRRRRRPPDARHGRSSAAASGPTASRPPTAPAAGTAGRCCGAPTSGERCSPSVRCSPSGGSCPCSVRAAAADGAAGAHGRGPGATRRPRGGAGHAVGHHRLPGRCSWWAGEWVSALGRSCSAAVGSALARAARLASPSPTGPADGPTRVPPAAARTAWPPSGGALVALVASVALDCWAGHASALPSGEVLVWAAATAHVLAAGAWAGGLLVLAVVLRPLARLDRGHGQWSPSPPGAPSARPRPCRQACSSATGLFEAGAHVGTWAALFRGVYGPAVWPRYSSWPRPRPRGVQHPRRQRRVAERLGPAHRARPWLAPPFPPAAHDRPRRGLVLALAVVVAAVDDVGAHGPRDHGRGIGDGAAERLAPTVSSSRSRRCRPAARYGSSSARRPSSSPSGTPVTGVEVGVVRRQPATPTTAPPSACNRPDRSRPVRGPHPRSRVPEWTTEVYLHRAGARTTTMLVPWSSASRARPSAPSPPPARSCSSSWWSPSLFLAWRRRRAPTMARPVRSAPCRRSPAPVVWRRWDADDPVGAAALLVLVTAAATGSGSRLPSGAVPRARRDEPTPTSRRCCPVWPRTRRSRCSSPSANDSRPRPRPGPPPATTGSRPWSAGLRGAAASSQRSLRPTSPGWPAGAGSPARPRCGSPTRSPCRPGPRRSGPSRPVPTSPRSSPTACSSSPRAVPPVEPASRPPAPPSSGRPAAQGPGSSSPPRLRCRRVRPRPRRELAGRCRRVVRPLRSAGHSGRPLRPRHGCHGIIVGDQAIGSSYGMAPGAQWIAARVFDDRGASTASAIHLAFQWVLDPDGDPTTDDAPDVVNLSWALGGGPSCDLSVPARHRRAARRGHRAGHRGGQLRCAIGPRPAPARGTTRRPSPSGRSRRPTPCAASSSTGPSTCGARSRVFPDVVAPGVGIYTVDRWDGVQSLTGTSVAAPHVTGALALLLQAGVARTRRPDPGPHHDRARPRHHRRRRPLRERRRRRRRGRAVARGDDRLGDFTLRATPSHVTLSAMRLRR